MVDQVKAENPKQMSGRILLLLTLVMLLGVMVRLIPVLSYDFPLNDGGMFYAMTQDLQQNNYRLPHFTSYNAAGIPFAYPPLGLYLAGVLDDLGPWTLVDILRFFPVVVSILTIGAFAALSWSMLDRPATAATAVLAFALFPRSFLWFIMGGGLTRSLGFFFAILAIREIYLVYVRPRRHHVILAGILAALAVLSHLQMAWWVALTSALMFVAFGRSRAALARSAIIATIVLALTAPWSLTTLSRHGIQTILGATHHAWTWYAGLVWMFLEQGTEPFLPVLRFLTLLGALGCLLTRRFFFPAWWLAVFLLDPRAPEATSTVPKALLVGIAVVEVMTPLVARAFSWLGRRSGRQPSIAGAVLPGDQRAAFVAVFVVVAVLSSTTALLMNRRQLRALPADEREAMAWVAANTPEDSVFVIMPSVSWWVDQSSEWFPVLAGRRSVATVQGSEWLPKDIFLHLDQETGRLKDCTTVGVGCLELWLAKNQTAVTHVYVPRQAFLNNRIPQGELAECCSVLRAQLENDPRYDLVYNGPGASIFERH